MIRTGWILLLAVLIAPICVFGNSIGQTDRSPLSFETSVGVRSGLTSSVPGSALYGTTAGGKTLVIAVPERWGVGDTLTLFAFALLAFGAAWRFGRLKPVVL